MATLVQRPGGHSFKPTRGAVYESVEKKATGPPSPAPADGVR